MRGPTTSRCSPRCAAEYRALDGTEFHAGVAAAGFAPLLDDESHGAVWIAEPSLGYAVVTWSWSVEIGGAEAVLDEIYVRDRGRGAGTQLVSTLEAECRRRGVRRIFLETEAPNAAARRLYERLGFEAEDSIWMAKRLR